MNSIQTLLIGLLAAFSLVVQADTIMIRNANVMTMTGDGTLENTDIFISGAKYNTSEKTYRYRRMMFSCSMPKANC